MFQHIREVTKMDANAKEHVFAMLDAFIWQTKMDSILS